MSDLVQTLREMIEWDCPREESRAYILRAADRIESLENAIKHCRYGPCPTLADLAWKDIEAAEKARVEG